MDSYLHVDLRLEPTRKETSTTPRATLSFDVTELDDTVIANTTSSVSTVGVGRAVQKGCLICAVAGRGTRAPMAAGMAVAAPHRIGLTRLITHTYKGVS
jgi:hypothetical protein